MRIMLVSHEASRTGAPRVAVLAARTLVGGGHTVRVVSRAPGPLLTDLSAAAPTTVEPFGRVRRRLWTWRPTRRIALVFDVVVALAMLLRHRPGLLYLNSASSAVYVRAARWLRVPVLLHVHESGVVAEGFLRANRVDPALTGITLVACSPSVQAELADLSGVPVETIVMLPSVPDDDTVVRLAHEPVDQVDLGPGLVVGACGTVERRKGSDLWVEVSRRVQELVPELAVSFVWVGDVVEPVPADDRDRATFVGPRSNPYPYLNRFDVMTLTSRDDPFPLVVLEAMTLGAPVVAFDVGAVALQVGDTGALVPPGDVDAFATRVVELLRDDDLRARLGAAARDRVAARYSTASFSRALAVVVDERNGTA